MRDPRGWREVFIRGGIMTIVAAIAYWLLDAAAWVWLFPVVISLLVIGKWTLRAPDDQDPPDEIA